MEIDFQQPKATYIVAVSGGVDSMCLLHILHLSYPDNNYVVAHVNHGIRNDSDKDMQLVRRVAKDYGMVFEYTELGLGSDASEAEARTKRYEFLQSTKNKYRARAIITAHHQDDVIETMFINIIRGTGRKGLSSLRSHSDLLRPMLSITKAEIYAYAKSNTIDWHEDSTNNDKKILRNKIRHDVIAKMSIEQRTQALLIIEKATLLNQKIDKELNILLKRGLHKGLPVVNRQWFCSMSHTVSCEIIHTVLSQVGVLDLDRKSIEKTVVAIKTMQVGKCLQLSGVDVLMTKRSARFILRGKTDTKQV